MYIRYFPHTSRGSGLDRKSKKQKFDHLNVKQIEPLSHVKEIETSYSPKSTNTVELRHMGINYNDKKF